jgi:hypothetical protein
VAKYTVKGELFVPDKPRVWFAKQLANIGLGGNLDPEPDGNRFVVLIAAETQQPREAQNHISLVVNFLDEVLRRVAAQGK